MAELKRILSSPVEIYALGGLGEVGKNLYCIENDSSLLIIDCGVMFPDASMPGVDYVVPDFTHLVENKEKIKGLVITHGHEDHIGGIPFLLRQIDI
ncbi:MAG: MBL fold metallo-hydrolase, partial [Candidatus Enterosoma sp.]|nr:MBL fold metallo-hydrolase [Candidatus Enterosoma sp.]